MDCHFENPLTDTHNTQYPARLKSFFRDNLATSAHQAHFQAVIPEHLLGCTQQELEEMTSFDHLVDRLVHTTPVAIVLPASG